MVSFYEKKTPVRKGRISTTVESAFEETKSYVLTELGKQFVHYTMNEVVPRLEATSSEIDRKTEQ